MQQIHSRANSRITTPIIFTKQRKKRSNSQVEEYQFSKYLYPFVKPKYINDDMFEKQSFTETIADQLTFKSEKTRKKLNNQVNSLKNNISQIREEITKQKKFYKQKLNRQRFAQSNQIERHRIKLKSIIKLKTQPVQRSQTERQSNNLVSLFLERKKKKTTHQEDSPEKAKEEVQVQEIYRYPAMVNNQYSYPKIFENITVKQPISIKGYIKKQTIAPPPPPKPKKQPKKIDLVPLKRRVRIKFYIVLFVVRLKKYNLKYREKRLNYVKRYTPSFTPMFFQIKTHFLHGLTDFFSHIINQDNKTIFITYNDSKQVVKQKITTIRRIINDLLRNLVELAHSLMKKKSIVELIYHVCKHGSIAHRLSILSKPQISLLCISESFGYISGDSHAQKVSIMSCLFVKIIIFNIFYQPECIEVKTSILSNRANFLANLNIIGNVCYEIGISVQDDYLDSCSELFVVNNWKKLEHKWEVHLAPTMTIKKGFVKKNQLISGLIDQQFIKNIYQIEQMRSQRKLIAQFIGVVFQGIRKKHREIFLQCI